jgi:hypothetical protein
VIHSRGVETRAPKGALKYAEQMYPLDKGATVYDDDCLLRRQLPHRLAWHHGECHAVSILERGHHPRRRPPHRRRHARLADADGAAGGRCAETVRHDVHGRRHHPHADALLSGTVHARPQWRGMPGVPPVNHRPGQRHHVGAPGRRGPRDAVQLQVRGQPVLRPSIHDADHAIIDSLGTARSISSNKYVIDRVQIIFISIFFHDHKEHCSSLRLLLC